MFLYFGFCNLNLSALESLMFLKFNVFVFWIWFNVFKFGVEIIIALESFN
jgi:hypothetical protein